MSHEIVPQISEVKHAKDKLLNRNISTKKVPQKCWMLGAYVALGMSCLDISSQNNRKKGMSCLRPDVFMKIRH